MRTDPHDLWDLTVGTKLVRGNRVEVLRVLAKIVAHHGWGDYAVCSSTGVIEGDALLRLLQAEGFLDEATSMEALL